MTSHTFELPSGPLEGHQNAVSSERVAVWAHSGGESRNRPPSERRAPEGRDTRSDPAAPRVARQLAALEDIRETLGTAGLGGEAAERYA